MNLTDAKDPQESLAKMVPLGAAAQAGLQFKSAGNLDWSIRRLRTILCLSASPVFGFMAIITALSPGIDICSSASGLISFDGMEWMYALMCLFHLEAWLKRYAPNQPGVRNSQDLG
jgi:hypothetical protein